MGRLFEKELQAIDSTYQESVELDTSVIEHFEAIDAPVLIIGSGGSFSVARMVEYCFSRIGAIAKAITPLQLEEHQNTIYQCKVILLTAQGNNTDILNAFQYCNLLEAKAILAVCCSTKSKLRKNFRQNGHLFLWEKDMAFGKDGYLSVNSMIAMITVMVKAIYRFSGNDYFNLPEKMNSDPLEVLLKKYDSLEILSRNTIIVLHGGATTPVAIDMVSKFSEAALGNIQLVDYRNFAHGRHFWLSKRTDETGIIAFVDDTQQEIAEKTLNMVPDGIPVQIIKSEYRGIYGILMVYREMFGLVYSAGKKNGVNPGKPKVPDYGKKMYHTNNHYVTLEEIKKINKQAGGRAAYRKNGSLAQNNGFLQKYWVEAENYIKKLHKGMWYCLIFDYDGTLHWKGEETTTEKAIFEKLNIYLQCGCRIAVSTGRGKSARVELQKKVPEEFWGDIAIGYYNGAICGWLADNDMPQRVTEPAQPLMQLYERLSEDEVWRSCFAGWEAPKPKQWSLSLCDTKGRTIAFEILRESVAVNSELKLASSSHSMDVMGSKTYKNNILDFIRGRWNSIHVEDCLFFGDAGELGGNDFEMLCHNGLSVDRVSKNRESCFNFAPLGMRQLEATLYYLEHMELNENGSLKFNL